jgi:hypothetical protein
MLRERIGNLLIAGKVYQDAKTAKKRLVKRLTKGAELRLGGFQSAVEILIAI